jgi:hypothetical protein
MSTTHAPFQTLKCAALNAGELLDTPPPGVDEAIAIAKVIQFLKVGQLWMLYYQCCS